MASLLLKTKELNRAVVFNPGLSRREQTRGLEYFQQINQHLNSVDGVLNSLNSCPQTGHKNKMAHSLAGVSFFIME